MSLEQLRMLRRAGRRPASVVVVVGKPSVCDEPHFVEAHRGADLRVLVGLPVHVIDVQQDPAVTAQVLDSLLALKVQFMGICGPAGACGVNEQHEQAMQRFRETICLS